LSTESSLNSYLNASALVKFKFKLNNPGNGQQRPREIQRLVMSLQSTEITKIHMNSVQTIYRIKVDGTFCKLLAFFSLGLKNIYTQ